MLKLTVGFMEEKQFFYFFLVPLRISRGEKPPEPLSKKSIFSSKENLDDKGLGGFCAFPYLESCVSKT